VLLQILMAFNRTVLLTAEFLWPLYYPKADDSQSHFTAQPPGAADAEQHIDEVTRWKEFGSRYLFRPEGATSLEPHDQ